MQKILIIGFISILAAFLFVMYQYVKFNDNKLHVVFCNVGQGDGIVIRTPTGSNILVDGGPDDSIIQCLSNHTPFWDHTINLMILTHPHTDHFVGLIAVLKRYTVLSFATENITNDALGFKDFLSEVTNQHLKPGYVLLGNSFTTPDAVTIHIVGPSKEFLLRTSPNGKIGESKEFGSVETLLSYGLLKILLTGDSQADELQDALNSSFLSKISVLQVPHHGSRTGLTREILQILNPKLAVISVGAKNPYGHPSPLTLALLKYENIKFLRTDQKGDVEIMSDGKTWNIL